MILKISLRAKGGVPKTLLEQKHRLNFLYFPQNTLMLTESREEFSDLHSIFRLRALRYTCSGIIIAFGERKPNFDMCLSGVGCPVRGYICRKKSTFLGHQNGDRA